MTREGHPLLTALIATICLAGCHSAQVAEYPTYAPAVVAYAPARESDNAFDSYALIAEDVERIAGKHLRRVAFTPGQKADAQRLFEPYVRRLAIAARKNCQFEFSARGPLDPPSYQRGWRLLGWCLYWGIQDACTAGNYDKAVSDTVLATRFGFDLTGGGAVDASTGYRIVDDARKALALNLDHLSAEQLRKLEEGIKADIARKPAISLAISHEQANMMASIQALQDAFRDGKLDTFQTAFGPDVREPIAYLKDLQPTDGKRSAFFSSLATYANEMVKYADTLSATPVLGRAKIDKPAMPKDHPWRRLAKYIVHAPIPLLTMNDITTARTRLFVIEAELTRRRKIRMALPMDLSGFSSGVSLDPYTGQAFVYHSNGEDYLVYSVGADGLDNAGQTDSAFLQPDLRLERPIP